ncbi:MAG: type IV fimbrial biogenesis protein FimT [Granulosicoccus sp.]|jgi:type IV fimbrial biogenesis protein FimT
MSTPIYTRGFSLIELLVTISISSILLSIVAPNLQNIIQSNEADSKISTLRRLLQVARTRAIVQQQSITICGSNDGHTCLKHWQNYLLVFHDSNNDKTASAEEIIYSEPLNIGQANIKTRLGFGRISVKINSLGQTNLTGSFIYCPPSNKAQYSRRLTWNRVGRSYRGRDTNHDGIIEDTDGKAISCSSD